MKTGTVKVVRTSYGDFEWKLLDRDGHLTGRSHVYYTRRDHAARGWERFRRLVAKAVVEKAK